MTTDRNVKVRLEANVAQYIAAMKAAGAATKELHDDIDKSSDRTAWLAQGILALTPAVTTLGAAAVPVISGLATQMTVAAAAGGTMALAFNGVGDGLSALNKYQLEPTDANLVKLQQSMAKIGPEGEEFVRFLDSLGPAFSDLANTARGGMFPGMTEGLTEFMDLMPRFQSIVAEISSGIGELAASAGADLAGEEWEAFFNFLETDAKPTLIEMGNTLGNFAQGLGSMMVAFGPLSADFSSGFEGMSKSFADWSAGLSDSDGFQEFVDYVQKAAPLALDFLGSLAMAFVELAEAAAVIGPSALKGLTMLLDVIGSLLDTPLGPLVIGFAALTATWGRLNAVAAITGSGVMGKAAGGFIGNLKTIGTTAGAAGAGLGVLSRNALKTGAATEKMGAQNTKALGSVTAFGKAAGPVAGQIGLLAVAMSDVDDKFGLTNTTALTLAGSFLGPWGAAVGGGAGLLLDMRSATDETTKGFQGLDAAIDSGKIEELTQRIAEAKAEMADQQDVTGFRDFFSDGMRDLGTVGMVGDTVNVYADAVAKAEAELAKLQQAEQDVASDKTFYNSLMAQNAALTANIDAMRTKRAEALKGLNAELDYKGAILDAKDALKENGSTVNQNTRKGQANLQVLYQLAAAWNAQSDATKSSAKATRAARQNFVDIAQAMGMGEDAARRLARQLFELPAKVPITIGVDHETAMAHVRALKAELASIRDEDVYINVRKVNASGFGPQATSSADGSTVPKSGRAYADRFPYLLADGEEVTSNRRGQADRYRSALKAINADMPRDVIRGMLAGGGTVGGTAAERLAVLEAEKAVAQLERELAKDGKNKITGRDRDIAQAQLQVARQELRDARAAIGAEAQQTVRDTELAQQEADAQSSAAFDEQTEADAEHVAAVWAGWAEEAARVQKEHDDAVMSGMERAWDQATSDSQKRVDLAADELAAVQSSMDSIGKAATSAFSSSWFGGSSEQKRGLWVGDNMGAAGDWRSKALGDIAGLQERQGLITQLSGQGLTGAALEDLLGNQSNEGIAAMLAGGQIGDFAALFSQRSALMQSVSGQAGQAGYGAEYAVASTEMARMNAQFEALTAAITAARPITVLEAISAQATAQELARLMQMQGAA